MAFKVCLFIEWNLFYYGSHLISVHPHAFFTSESVELFQRDHLFYTVLVVPIFTLIALHHVYSLNRILPDTVEAVDYLLLIIGVIASFAENILPANLLLLLFLELIHSRYH